MGYELHITRADDWSDSTSRPVTLEEWKAYIAIDGEMQMDNSAEATLADDQVLRYENEGLAVWTSYSRHGQDGNKAWFDWRSGRIVVKNPDEEIIGKMVAIARALNAHVQGDDGERYDEQKGAPQRETAQAKRWWKRLFGR